MGLDITVERFVSEKSEEDVYDDHHYKLWEMDNIGNIVDAVNLNFPEWVTAMKATRKFDVNDWKEYKERTGVDILNDYRTYMIGPLNQDTANDDELEYGYVFEAIDRATEPKHIRISEKDIKTIEMELPVVYYEERGYQRKGLNGQFYQDYEDGKIGYFVWTKAELERYLRDYVEDDRKAYFKEHIVDVFEDGKDVCTFDW